MQEIMEESLKYETFIYDFCASFLETLNSGLDSTFDREWFALTLGEGTFKNGNRCCR